MNARRRRKSKSSKRRRSFRRNPVVSLGGIQSTVKRTIPLAITGGASIIAVNMVPSIARVTSPVMRYGAQAASILGGGIAVGKFVGKEHGMIWTVAGAAAIAADLLQRFVVGRFLPSAPVSAPATVSDYVLDDGYGAYGMDAYAEDLSAYPY